MAKRGALVGLDIGTTKVCVIVAEQSEDGEVHITGMGTSPSVGVRKGVVVDLDATTRAIEEAVDKAERMAGLRLSAAVVGVSGGHLASQNSRGEAARMAAVPASDREIVHLLPRDFVVDGQDGVKNPVGMYGTRLEVEAHIVTGASTLLANLLKCVQRAGLECDALVLEPLASGEAVLSPAERELGVALVDIGGGTISLGLFASGGLCYTAVLPYGGNHVTNDIAMGLRTSFADAERLKIRHGCALPRQVGEDELIEVVHVGSHELRVAPKRALSEIIEPRVSEMAGLVKAQCGRSGWAYRIPAGLVVTGGTALLRGLPDLISERLGIAVRVGVPDVPGSMADTVSSPAFATGVGLVLHAVRQRRVGRSLNGNGTVYGRVR
ncbi:MAG: cell division protein FtsA, partial [Bacillati bacterium ANGP1]